MFDLVTGNLDRPLHDRHPGATAVSVAAHIAVLATVLVPLLYVTGQVPRVRNAVTTMVFVAAQPPAIPPPPRPVAPALEREPVIARSSRPVRVPAVSASMPPAAVAPEAAPVVAPSSIAPETPFAGEGGVIGGAGPMTGEGSSAGGGVGITGGLVGVPLVQPPPPPPVPHEPVRIGGRIAPPKLIRQVQPVYPLLAAAAQVTGVVILEATVGADGLVQSVHVLRGNAMLEQAAVDAVKQWQYSPVLVDGTPVPFIVTVTVNFRTRRPS